jgi:maleylpyruvate isomerase
MTARVTDGAGATAYATDLDRTWELGDGPTVSGTAADLGWWLTGRGAGEGLSSDSGELPRIEEW